MTLPSAATPSSAASGPGLHLPDEAWKVHLDDATTRELASVVASVRRSPAPVFLRHPDQFDLQHTRLAVEQARRILEHGAGVVVLDRLALDDWTEDETLTVYWLIARLLGQPVAQSFAGTIFHTVKDYGRKAEPGSAVRPNATNADMAFHNDNAFNPLMPDYVGLLCFHPAKSGGISKTIRFEHVHDLMRQHYPEHLPRLYEPFWLFRNGQHPADEPPVLSAPMFEQQDGKIRARFGLHMVYGGYRHLRLEIDSATQAALHAVEQVFEQPAHQFSFSMERGQIQFVRNIELGHKRTAFIDHEDPALQRNLVRIWLRDQGGPGYFG